MHGRGSLALSIEPGQAQIIDTAALAAQAGTVPPCSRFVFLFSWQVDRPSGIRIVGDDGDGSFEVVSGASGEASIGGCVALEALNESDEIVVGELLYFIAESGNEP